MTWLLGYYTSTWKFIELYQCTGDDEHVLLMDVNPEENANPNPGIEINGYSVFKRVEMKLTNEQYGEFKMKNSYEERHL